MNKNDDKVKRLLESAPVPQELEPENIRIMLEGKAPAKKRKKISVAARITAGAAACAVLCGTAVHLAEQGNFINKEDGKDHEKNFIVKTTESETSGRTEKEPIVPVSYMSGAESYEQIYYLLSEASERYKEEENTRLQYFGDMAVEEDAMETPDVETSFTGSGTMTEGTATIDKNFNGTLEPADDDDDSYSETYNQESGVLEADIAKTDGRYIYYLHNESNNTYDGTYKITPELNVAAVDNGSFISSTDIDLSVGLDNIYGEDYDIGASVMDMYLYNDMLLVIGNINAHSKIDQKVYNEMYDHVYPTYRVKNSVFVSVYTTGDNPQLVDTYYQEGHYSDVRIAPDGYMYLITDYTSESFEQITDKSYIERYIPTCGTFETFDCIPHDDLLLPEEGIADSNNISYKVISGLDLNTTGQITAVESKALTGYSGNIYCTAENLYTAAACADKTNKHTAAEESRVKIFRRGGMSTEITRIAIGGGRITPAASGKVEGTIKDQFSMSEYNGYFRIVTTNEEFEEVFHKYVDEPWYNKEMNYDDEGYYSYDLVKRDNRVYVLDMDMNVVGSVQDFGINESVKSVSFSGDLAYVVTYEQTDPLFAIDLSEPTNPTILDEFKILGYSTYMQQWDDGLLLGFGADADENGIETGVKLVMFDNSDPDNLDEVGLYAINHGENEWKYSPAMYERKALLIAPEKNLIGVPIVSESYESAMIDTVYGNEWKVRTRYMLFSYDNGEFTLKGEVGGSYEWSKQSDGFFDRAVYIGDYIYVLSGKRFVSADIETFTVADEIEFN